MPSRRYTTHKHKDGSRTVNSYGMVSWDAHFLFTKFLGFCLFGAFVGLPYVVTQWVHGTSGNVLFWILEVPWFFLVVIPSVVFHFKSKRGPVEATKKAPAVKMETLYKQGHEPLSPEEQVAVQQRVAAHRGDQNVANACSLSWAFLDRSYSGTNVLSGIQKIAKVITTQYLTDCEVGCR